MRSRVVGHCFLLALFLGLSSLICIADRAPLHVGELQVERHFLWWLSHVRGGTIGGPYVYRILVPYSIDALHRLVPALSAVSWDLVLKLLFLTALQLTFQFYLLKFFGFIEGLAGVFLLDVLIGFALVWLRGPHFIETADILATLFFVLGFMALHAERYLLVCALLFVGTLNRETPWLALPPIFLQEWFTRRSASRSIAATGAVAVPYFGLKMWFGNSTWSSITPRSRIPFGCAWFDFTLRSNLPFWSGLPLWDTLVSNAHVLLLLGPMAALALYRFREQPRFLQYVAAIAPLFVLVHYAVGIIGEGRMWIPLFPVLIPLALGTLKRLFQESAGALPIRPDRPKV